MANMIDERNETSAEATQAENFAEFLEKGLNPPQREAVTHPGGPLLVLAGAGSGKTRVITYRIAHLVKELGIRPWRILAVTFTNKAAGEMRQRVEGILGDAARQVWLGTFHSTCARILRKEIERLGMPGNFTIYDRSDQTALIRRCLKHLSVSERELKPAGALGQISNAKQNLMTPKDCREESKGGFNDTIAEVYDLYQTSLRHNSAVDFDDLLMYTVFLLRDYNDVRDTYQRRFDHVLVDEYQDTNHAQYLIVKTLAAPHRNLCVVGDDDQSIYSWRGAIVENILKFDRDWPDAHAIRLEQNYRSTGHILSASGGLIERNKHRKPKRLWTEADAGEKVRIVGVPDQNSEASWVAEQIEELTDEEIGYQDFAVFYRTNAQSRSFEEAFSVRRIPYIVIGGMSFYERKEVKDLLAYLRLLVSPGDQVAFQRVVNVPSRKIGATTVDTIIAYADELGIPVTEAAALARDCGELRSTQTKALVTFGNRISAWRDLAKTASITELLRRVLEESGYDRMLREDTDPQSESRIENLDELVTAAAQAEKRHQEQSEEPLSAYDVLGVFLDDIALITDVDKLSGEERVALITLHSAKGLEFPVVFLTGFEDGLIPHANAMSGAKIEINLEEERRLCYVGMTRAMRYLYLTHAHSRMSWGRTEPRIASRFIKDIPKEHVQQLPYSAGYTSGDRRSQRSGMGQTFSGIEYDPGYGPSSGIEFQLGDTVTHRTFGLGVVLSVKGRGDNAKLQVDFQSVGEKKLIQGFARLKKV